MLNNYDNRKNQDAEYAGFWVRLAAYCIDCAIVWIGLLFVKLVISILSLSGGGIFQAKLLFQYTLKDIILYILEMVYFILLTYETGTTLGKRLLNLRVVNADGSQKLDFVNVLYRETVGRFLCSLSIGIGYIMAGVDREKRGLHDMLCDTRVIYAKKIKLIPTYQAPNNYPMTPPVPPVQGPGVPLPWGNGMQGQGPISPQGQGMQGQGPIPPQGSVPPQGQGMQDQESAAPQGDSVSLNGEERL